MSLARSVAQRSTCLRRMYGSVVENNGKVVSTGYCGAPKGAEHCASCYRKTNNILAGQDYGKCRGVHSEGNSLLWAGIDKTIGGNIYVAGYDLENDNKEIVAIPCFQCTKMIVNAEIKYIVVAKIGDFPIKWDDIYYGGCKEDNFVLIRPVELYNYYLNKLEIKNGR